MKTNLKTILLILIVILTLTTGCTSNEGKEKEQINEEKEVVKDENKEDKEEEPVVEEHTKKSIGDIVYFDVQTGKLCNTKDTMQYHPENSTTGYNGINGTNNQTSCLKFYALTEDHKTLLLDHNTTAVIEWNNNFTGKAEKAQPTTVLAQLNQDTKDWIGTKTPTNYKDPLYGTINYKGYKARLINAIEVANATGNTEWKTSGEYYFYDTNNQTNKKFANNEYSKYHWLYDYTKWCKRDGCKIEDNSTQGYWTSTSTNDQDFYGYVWVVGNSTVFTNANKFQGTSLNEEDRYGIRPVIELE